MIVSSLHVHDESLVQFFSEGSLFRIRNWLWIFHISETKYISVKYTDSFETVQMSSTSSKKPGKYSVESETLLSAEEEDDTE